MLFNNSRYLFLPVVNAYCVGLKKSFFYNKPVIRTMKNLNPFSFFGFGVICAKRIPHTHETSKVFELRSQQCLSCVHVRVGKPSSWVSDVF